jgi:hypothetical protein
MVYSWGLGIKMSLLLALPGIAMVLYQAMLPVGRAIRQAILMGQLQVSFRVVIYFSSTCEPALTARRSS